MLEGGLSGGDDVGAGDPLHSCVGEMLLLEDRHQVGQIGLLELRLELLRCHDGGLEIATVAIEVEGVGRRHDADEHEHDQPHSLLAVVGAMGEAHRGAGADEERADPAWGRLVPVRRLVELLGGNQRLAEEEKASGEGKADQRREDQGDADFACLVPVDPLGERAVFEEGVHHPHPHDRADQRVGARGGKAAVPGGEVPDDGGAQQRQHHRQAAAGLDVDEEIDREEVDDAEGDPDPAGVDPDEVPDSRPDHRPSRLHRLGVDDGGDGVGRVVEAVDALEPEGDGQRDQQEDQLAGAERREGFEKFHDRHSQRGEPPARRSGG